MDLCGCENDLLTKNELKQLKGGKWITTGYHGIVLNGDGSIHHTVTWSFGDENLMNAWVEAWRAVGYGCNFIPLGYDDGTAEDDEPYPGREHWA